MMEQRSMEMINLFTRKQEAQKMTDEEKDLKVLSEVTEAQKCVERGDTACTVQHLREAHRYEDCGVCRNQIKAIIRQAPYLPREKQALKVALLKDYVQPAAGLHKTFINMQAIKPSTRAKLTGKAKQTLKATGRSLKRGMGWMKNKLSSKVKPSGKV